MEGEREGMLGVLGVPTEKRRVNEVFECNGFAGKVREMDSK